MDKVSICTKLEETTYFVTVFTGQEPLDPETTIASGSGIAINNRGDLLTAAHVVTGRLPVKPEDLRDPDVKIIAKTSRGPFIQYRPVLCGPGIKNEFMTEPLTIDLAILRALPSQENVAYIPISRQAVQVGRDVLMAGFPDDMELPLSFDAVLDARRPENVRAQKSLRVAKQLLMIKSGMVGYKGGMVLSDGVRSISGEMFYIDNELQMGASGGPVVDENLEVVGIMTKRAITAVPFRDAPDLRVPSGSTVALSPRIIQDEIDKLTNTS